MIYTVINDTHIFGPLQNMTFDDLRLAIKTSQHPVVLNGDVIDLKNCSKSEVAKAKDAILYLRGLPHCVYLTGNHELTFGEQNLPARYIEGHVYFEHSDLLSNKKKYSEFRKKKAGAGFFKRHVITPLIDAGRHLIEARPNDELRASVARIKKQYPQITVAIFGHAHPRDQIEFTHAGVKCLILKRGVNVVDV